MRRDLVMMGTIAAVVGVGLAAGLTAALGVRSSGTPAPLRTAASPAQGTPAVSVRVDRPPAQVARKRDKPRRRKPRRVATPAPAPSPPPVVAQAAPEPAPAPAPVEPQPTQQVSTPAPQPAPPPPKPLSRPKPTNSGGGGGGGSPGVSFDDSG